MKVMAIAILFWTLTAFAVQDAKPATTPVRISATEAGRLLLKSAHVVYPEGSEDLTGVLALELRIDTEGNVVNVDAGSGKPELAAAAVAVFKQYRFKPYEVAGKPVEFRIAAAASFEGRATGAKLSLQPLKLRVSQGVLDGSKIRDAQPKYPPLAWRSHIQGDVVLTATLGTDGGDLSNIRIVSGHPVLIQAAMDAVRQWKYKPFLLNGVPVEVDTVITVQFHF